MTEVLILRGLPGSGKTTYARTLTDAHHTVLVFSADDYFVSADGAYHYDPKQAGSAHVWCFKRFLEAFQAGAARAAAGDALLVVDNTNTTAAEIAPYVAVANAYELKHTILTFVCDPLLATRRNNHGVPWHVVWRMHRALLVDELPPWWNHTVHVPPEAGQHT